MRKGKEKINEQEMEITAPSAETDTPPVVEVSETEITTTPTSRSRAWMEAKYPDETWDDETLDAKMADHLASTDARIAEYAENEEVIGRVLEANPEFALAIEAMGKGMPARVAIRRYLGDVLAEPDNGDDDFEEYQEAAEKFLAEKKAADEEIATRTSNLEKSDIVLKEFVERTFPTEQEQVDFVEYLRATLRNIGMGEFSEAFFEMMYKAYTHDKDVDEAKEAGAIEARNEKITAKRIKANEETDGLPMGGGSSPIVTDEEPEDDSFLGGVLRDYERRRR